MSFLSNIFDHPVTILILYVIGFLGISSPPDTFNFFLGIFILVMNTINLAKYIKKKSKKPVRPKCEYCGYISLDERELHNHQINCDKKKEADNKKGVVIEPEKKPIDESSLTLEEFIEKYRGKALERIDAINMSGIGDKDKLLSIYKQLEKKKEITESEIKYFKECSEKLSKGV